MKHLKKHFTTFILVMIMLTGISLLLYPAVSNWWNKFHQTRAIASYTEAVTELENRDYEEIRRRAREYNRKLLEKKDRWKPLEEDDKEYEEILNPEENGIMGYVEIPVIGVSLPIYHGTDEAILQIAAGHIRGSSFPTWGESTHCVISGHSGLPSARLFTELEKVKEGEIFYLKVLDETLAYEVDQIRVVEPEDFSLLEIEAGKDFCTLVTCTPYGINTHRLLVRGTRIETPDRKLLPEENAEKNNLSLVALVTAVSVLLAGLILGLTKMRKRKREETMK